MADEMLVQIEILEEGRGLPLPEYMTSASAGMDLRAAVKDAVTLPPGESALIPVGFRMALPPGYEAQIRPRSGLALKHKVTLLNSPGTVDSDYRGPVCVILINLGSEPHTVRRGDRIAQMIVAPVSRASVQVVEKVPQTERNAGGFGHTGVS